jgi:hypothetical protein
MVLATLWETLSQTHLATLNGECTSSLSEIQPGVYAAISEQFGAICDHNVWLSVLQAKKRRPIKV